MPRMRKRTFAATTSAFVSLSKAFEAPTGFAPVKIFIFNRLLLNSLLLRLDVRRGTSYFLKDGARASRMLRSPIQYLSCQFSGGALLMTAIDFLGVYDSLSFQF